MTLRLSSLRLKLTVPLILLALALGLAAYLLVERQISGRLLAEFDTALAARAQALQNLAQFEEADPEEGENQPFLEFEFEPELMPAFGEASEHEGREADEAGAAYFQLWRGERTIARSPTMEDDNLPRHPGAEVRDLTLPDGRAGRMLTVEFHPYLDEEWGDVPAARPAQLRARYPELTYPELTLAVAVSRESLDDTLAFVQLVLGTGLLVLTLLIGGAAAVVTARGLRPVHRLADELSGIDSRRLDARVSESTLPDELKPVARTANSLLGRLQQAFDRERLFSRNVAHELRTPIAELRSIADVATRWPDDPEENARFFEDVGTIANRMDLMVSNLLMMARQENGHNGCVGETIDLVRAVRGGCERFGPEAEQRGMEVSLRAPSAVPVVADRVYLDIVASNLLSNAIQHGGPPGQIAVEVFADNGAAGFMVENPANGLSREDLPYLFDRFWRKDEARTTGRHVGLGLPLVRTLADACGWRVDAALTADHRFRIRVSQMQVAVQDSLAGGAPAA